MPVRNRSHKNASTTRRIVSKRARCFQLIIPLITTIGWTFAFTRWSRGKQNADRILIGRRQRLNKNTLNEAGLVVVFPHVPTSRAARFNFLLTWREETFARVCFARKVSIFANRSCFSRVALDPAVLIVQRGTLTEEKHVQIECKLARVARKMFRLSKRCFALNVPTNKSFDDFGGLSNL